MQAAGHQRAFGDLATTKPVHRFFAISNEPFTHASMSHGMIAIWPLMT
jgi:hypothetical protein